MSQALAKAAPAAIGGSNVVQLNTGRDPIFAAMAAFETAYRRYTAYNAIWVGVCAKHPALDRRPRAFYGWLLVTSENRREPMYAYSAIQIDEIFDREMDLNRNHRWLTSRVALQINCKRVKAKLELERDAAELQRQRDETGWTLAHENMMRAMNEMNEAQDALCRTQCTTIEGVKALASLALRRVQDGMWDDYYTQKFIAGLAGKRAFQ